MTTYAVQLHQLEAVPLAVIRRHVSRSELARVVPECCGLVWSAVKAQQARGGRHVAVYLDGTIRLEVGAAILGPFSERDDVVHQRRRRASWRRRHISVHIPDSARPTRRFAAGARRTNAPWPVRTGKSTGIGCSSGTTTHRRFEPTSTICFRIVRRYVGPSFSR